MIIYFLQDSDECNVILTKIIMYINNDKVINII